MADYEVQDTSSSWRGALSLIGVNEGTMSFSVPPVFLSANYSSRSASLEVPPITIKLLGDIEYPENTLYFELPPVKLMMAENGSSGYLLLTVPPVEVSIIGQAELNGGTLGIEVPAIQLEAVAGLDSGEGLLSTQIPSAELKMLGDELGSGYLDAQTASVQLDAVGDLGEQPDFGEGILGLTVPPITIAGVLNHYLGLSTYLDIMLPQIYLAAGNTYLQLYEIPPFILDMSERRENALSTPMPSFSFSFSTDVRYTYEAQMEMEIPMPEVDLWHGGKLTVSLESVSAAFAEVPYFVLDLPGIAALLSGQKAIQGVKSLSLPSLEMSLTGDPLVNGSFSASVLAPYAELTANISTSYMEASLPAPTLAAIANLQLSATLEAEMPAVSASFSVSLEFLAGELSAQVGMLRIWAAAELAGVLAGEALVMNTETSTLTRYTNVPFNAVFALGSKVYACGANGGLYEITGQKDGTSDIEASIKFPTLDLSKVIVKRLSHAFLTMRGEGQVTVYEGTNSYSYDISPTTDLDERRVKFGKGLRKRFLDIEITNKQGSNLEIDTVTLFADRETRRRR